MDTDTDEQPVSRAVKFVGPDTIEGLAFPFDSRDTDGETFIKGVDLCDDWFGSRPLLYNHGLDRAHKAKKVGVQTAYEEREGGIWAQAQLNANALYRKHIDELIEKGALGYSSGAYGHLAKKNARQEIVRWPWVELSLTPFPANPETLGVHYVKSADVLALFDDLPPAVAAAIKAIDEWVPTDDDALPDGAKFADLIDRLSVDGPAWVKARRDWYAKSGRVLSAATRERLAAHPSALRQLADDLDELLASADAPKKSIDLWAEAIKAELATARLLGVSIDIGDPIQ